MEIKVKQTNTDVLQSEEEKIKATWSALWQSKNEIIDDWDSLSELILTSLVSEIGFLRGKNILEAGCGSGRISARLASLEAYVSCLDIAQEALEISKLQFKNLTKARFILGSILSLPTDYKYDIIWNSGVLEHFNKYDQKHSLDQFLEALNPEGKLVIYTPYSKSPIYRIVKYILEKTNKWPFGREVPVASLFDVVPARGKLEKEYLIAFLPLILDAYKWFRPLKTFSVLVRKFTVGVIGQRGFLILDKIMSRICGGYLLVSVIKNR